MLRSLRRMREKIMPTILERNTKIPIELMIENLCRVQSRLATLEATQGQILSDSPTDATSGKKYLNGS